MATNNIPYGTNITASSAKEYLKENSRTRAGVNTWNKFLSGAGMTFADTAGKLQTDYSDTINQAYKSSLANQNVIAGAGLARGSANKLSESARSSMLDAYNTYVGNYKSALSEAAEQYSTDVGSIESAQDTEAANVASLFSNLYKYASDELGSSMTNTTDTSKGTAVTTPISLMQKLSKEGLSNKNFFDTDENGNEVLKSWDLLSRELFNDGKLTQEGIDFYTSLLKLIPTDATNTNDSGDTWNTRTFGKWLSDVDPELYTWYQSADPYSYTTEGRRVGTINQMLGKKSTAYITPISDQPSLQTKTKDELLLFHNEMNNTMNAAFSSLDDINTEVKSKYDELLSNATNIKDMLPSTRYAANKDFNTQIINTAKETVKAYQDFITNIPKLDDYYNTDDLKIIIDPNSADYQKAVNAYEAYGDAYNEFVQAIKSLNADTININNYKKIAELYEVKLNKLKTKYNTFVSYIK